MQQGIAPDEADEMKQGYTYMAEQDKLQKSKVRY